MNEQEQAEMLKSKHHKLEVELENENSRPHPDDVHIAELKKEKLRIKDELASMNAL